MDIVIKTNRCFVKSGDRKSELTEGKLVIDLDNQTVRYNGKKVTLEPTDKEKSIHYLWLQAFDETSQYALAGNWIKYKRKGKAKKNTNSLI